VDERKSSNLMVTFIILGTMFLLLGAFVYFDTGQTNGCPKELSNATPSFFTECGAVNQIVTLAFVLTGVSVIWYGIAASLNESRSITNSLSPANGTNPGN
jgi:hypothetical protein